MLLTLFLLASIIITVFLSLQYSSEYISTLLFVWLLTYIIFKLTKNYILKLFRPNLKFVSQIYYFQKFLTKRNIFLGIITVSFLAGFSRVYYLGGDDSKLFYLYPLDYLTNFALSPYPGNSVSAMIGFLPSSSIIYFAGFLTFLKIFLPFVNLQAMLYTANLLFGMYFFYLLIEYLIESPKKYSSQIYFVASFFYVFSIFNIYILYNARLIPIYLVSVFPLTLYLFARAVKENKNHFIFIAAVIWSVFCVMSAASFWMFAAVLTVFPLIIYISKVNYSQALKNTAVFAALLLLLNIHWIYLVPYTTLFNKTGIQENNALSQQFLEESSRGLRENAEINEVFHPLNNLFHYKIQDNFKWPFLSIFNDWYLKLVPITSVFILIIIAAGIFRDRDKLGRLYGASLFSLLLGIYFFTLNLGKTRFGNWGVEIFVWISNNVPGFVAFRNSYDKFAFGLSFVFATALAVSLLVISAKTNSEKSVRKLLFAVFGVSLLISWPYLSGRLTNLPVWKTQNSFHTTAGLNQDYLDLVDFVKTQKDVGRYLTLPLTRGNIAFIQDSNLDNHYYVGVSPLLILTGKNDYSGSLSFGVFEKEFNEYLLGGDFESLGRLLQKSNTKYIIKNNTISPDMQTNYLLSDGLYDLQNDEFLGILTGEKIRDFGSRYILYKIHPDFENEKVFAEANGADTRVSFSKVSDTEYHVSVSGSDTGGRLVLNEPYLGKWELYDHNGTKLNTPNIMYSDWANSWEIPNGNANYRIIFTPAKYQKYFMLIAFTSFLFSIIYILMSLRKEKHA